MPAERQQMRVTPSNASGWPAVLAASVGLCALALPAVAPGLSHWPLRLIVLALGLWSAVRLFRGPRATLILSPLVALGVLCPLFYSAVPALLVAIAGADLVYFMPAFSQGAARAYLSGTAELLVLQFAALCIAATGLVDMMVARHAPSIRPGVADRRARQIAGAVIALSVLLWVVLLVRYRSPAVAALMAAGPGRQAMDGIAPVLAATTAVAFALAVGRGRVWLVGALVCGLGSLAALLTTGAAKAGVLALAGALLLHACVARPPLRRLAGGAVLFAVAFAIAVGALAEFRQGYISIFARTPGGLPVFLERMLIAKIAGRQTETVACLQRVVERSAAEAPHGSPFYFATAVIPRVLWPEKPNLSLGARYAFEFCGYKAENMPADGSQSLSITLIGQPLAEAGIPGLAVAEIVLVIGLGLGSLAAARSGMTGAITLAALTPWLADFDQSFALYVANAVKMLLYMSPVLIAYALAVRHAVRGRIAAAAP